jgi:hypothetical protein
MGPLIVATGVLWVWALCIIRMSVALMLLRLKDSRPWKITVWTVIAVQVCMVIVGTTMHLVLCDPISARWAKVGDFKCIPDAEFMKYGYVYSSMSISAPFNLHVLLGLLVPAHFPLTPPSQHSPSPRT